jgi:hypothetical protein
MRAGRKMEFTTPKLSKIVLLRNRIFDKELYDLEKYIETSEARFTTTKKGLREKGYLIDLNANPEVIIRAIRDYSEAGYDVDTQKGSRCINGPVDYLVFKHEYNK